MPLVTVWFVLNYLKKQYVTRSNVTVVSWLADTCHVQVLFGNVTATGGSAQRSNHTGNPREQPIALNKCYSIMRFIKINLFDTLNNIFVEEYHSLQL